MVTKEVLGVGRAQARLAHHIARTTHPEAGAFEFGADPDTE